MIITTKSLPIKKDVKSETTSRVYTKLLKQGSQQQGFQKVKGHPQHV